MVFRIKDIQPGLGSSQPRRFTALGGRVFFMADADGTGPELWISDGTEAGTRMISDLSPTGFGGSSPGDAGRAVFGGVYFFDAYNGISKYLYRTDGLITTLVDPVTTNPDNLVVVGGQLFYAGASNLWRLNAVGAIPFRMTDALGNGFNPFHMTAVGSELFFVNGNDIWRTNGALATRLNSPAVPFGIPYTLAAVGSRLFFGATVFGATVSTGRFGLWTYSSPDLAPVFVRAFASLPGEVLGGLFQATRMAAFGSKLIFAANDGISGEELWLSDGTPGGTLQVMDINATGPGLPSQPDQFTVAGPARVYFVADDGIAGRELWRTDGTSAGTRRIADIYVGSGHSQPADLTVVGSKLYFTAITDAGSRQLWALDLVSENVRQLTWNGMFGGGTSFFISGDPHNERNLTVAGNTLFMHALRPLVDPEKVHDGDELWGLDLNEANKPVVFGITVINTTAAPSPGVSLLLTFSEPLSPPPLGVEGRFNVRVGSSLRSVTSVVQPSLTELVLNLAGPPLASGNVPVQVEYLGGAFPNVITDSALNPLAPFPFRNAETLSNDANVSVLHPTYANLILRGSASVGTANVNANRITVDQPAQRNVLNGNGLVDFMDGGEGGDLYMVTDVAHHGAAEISDSGAGGPDELRFASTSLVVETLSVFSSDLGLEIVSIGTGTTLDSPVRTGTAPKNVDALLAPNGLRILGNNGMNRLRGTQFADWIDGGGGLDTMDGGAGSDVYLVSRSGEHGAAEINDSGISLIDNDELRFTSITPNDTITVFGSDSGLNSVVLSTNVSAPAGGVTGMFETTALNVNAVASIGSLLIQGNDGRNVITGTQNQDTINGYAGDDLFLIPDATHHPFSFIFSEVINGGSGADEIRYSATAPAHDGQTLRLSSDVTGIERVTIGGGTGLAPTSTTLNLHVNAQDVGNSLVITGNRGANLLKGTGFGDRLIGDQGNDTLIGGLGQDDLTGGAGNDEFHFVTPMTDPLVAVFHRDRIADFAVGSDRIVLANAQYPGIPEIGVPLPATRFTLGTVATTPNHRIIYDRFGTGHLFYDRDGSASMYAPCQIAVLDPVGPGILRPALTAAHIWVR